MQFEWDADKARTNLAKHDVAFEDAILVWDDPLHVIVDDRIVDGKERFWAIGYVGAEKLLVVVHVHPDPDNDEKIRLISARKAMRHEQRRHEDGDL